MYCKKCKFHAFDHVSTCPKCGADWEESRKALYLNWITASGVNWVGPAKSTAQQAPAAKPATAQRPAVAVAAAAATPTIPDSDPPLGSLSGSAAVFTPAPDAPTRPAAPVGDIDVSSFPELDFSSSQPAAPTSSATKVSDDLFIEPLPDGNVVELDFSAPTAAPTKPKREDLFFSELEEMLAPLTDEPRPAPKKQHLSEEKEILLDFAAGKNGKPASDLDYLELDEPKKS